MSDGIPIEFMSRKKLEESDFDSKLEMIMEEVRDGKIIVLEESLTPQERRQLIEGSMENVDDDFPGIEFSSLDGGDFVDRIVNNLFSMIGRERKSGITIVGNSDVMEKVKEDRESVSFLAKSE